MQPIKNPTFDNGCASWVLSKTWYWTIGPYTTSTCMTGFQGNGSPSPYVYSAYSSGKDDCCHLRNAYAGQGWWDPLPGWGVPFSPDILHATCLNQQCDSYSYEGYTYTLTVSSMSLVVANLGNNSSPWFNAGLDFSIRWPQPVGPCNFASMEFMVDVSDSSASTNGWPGRYDLRCVGGGWNSYFAAVGIDKLPYSFTTRSYDISYLIQSVLNNWGLPAGTLTGGMIGVETMGYTVWMVYGQAKLVVTHTSACFGPACACAHCPNVATLATVKIGP